MTFMNYPVLPDVIRARQASETEQIGEGLTAQAGDWIVDTGTEYRVVPDATFRRLFSTTPIKEPRQSVAEVIRTRSPRPPSDLTAPPMGELPNAPLANPPPEDRG